MGCHLALLLLFMSGALGAQSSRGVVVRERLRPNPEEARAGREIYNRSCTMCHGLDGEVGDRAPALAAQRRYLRSSRADLFDAIKNGIKGTNMPAAALADGDVNKLIAYIHSLRATAADVEVAGHPADGETVFHGKGNCAQCHMIRGRGGLLGPDLSNIAAERKLEDLRAALTVARPVPPRGFQPVTITTTAGERVEGVAKNENNFSIQVLGRDGRLHLLTRDEIKEIRHGETSYMPSDVDRRLSKDEFQDLLAFLAKQSRRSSQ